ncbi:YjbF family lipoprotein [Halomonas sp. 328]|uniref:YjbF family lipoprotein n=1 Tax=Halomonas sp. 328 TaxID=2776704 RepID=UPI0018A70200|nr:YjbF family lipoprotein [Halomonas sp. 328]MBF8223916.1 YjbF family lipoprotein [Halomonas sp. 328]
MSASLQALWGSDGADAERAEALPHASLLVQAGDIRGLMVMGFRVGQQSYWPSADGLTLELSGDGLFAVDGLEQTLLATHYTGLAAASLPWHGQDARDYRVIRHWIDAQGQMQRGEAQARLHCGRLETRHLPLGERQLQRCHETLTWADGRTSRTRLWRDPVDHALWEVDGQPWPDAPRIAWRVARPWW